MGPNPDLGSIEKPGILCASKASRRRVDIEGSNNWLQLTL